jgi:hypothetical protein
MQLAVQWLYKWVVKCHAITQPTSQDGNQGKNARELKAEIDDALGFTLSHSVPGVEEWHTQIPGIERKRKWAKLTI